ncbi:MAG: hypothetical protein J7530_03090 [Novosphingobium sp.]|nr:hypothetical protein [Novosphingobium sp.]
MTGYALSLTPDVTNAALSGQETIVFRVTAARLDRLVITGNALTIYGARLDGKALVPEQRGKVPGGTVTSRDLQRAMEAASGRDLHTLFAEWVFGSDDAAEKG